jgi:hypothetical protein
MLQFVMQHEFWTAVVIYWIFSAAVSSMPDPASTGNPGYLWLFRFLHTIAGNITTAFGDRIPGAENKDRSNPSNAIRSFKEAK